MAKKKEDKAKVVLEREYNVPLRREFLKVQNNRRAKKAIMALKQFISKHMKTENVLVADFLNKEIWARGIRNPPHHVRVKALKYEDGKVLVTSVNAPVEKKEDKKAPKKPEAKKEVKPAPKKEEKVEAKEKPKAEVKKEVPKAKVEKKD